MSDKPLSTIIEAQAKMAMPEIVDVFLSKYENELYERKNEINADISEEQAQQEIDTASVITRLSKKFDQYAGIDVKKLGIVSYMSSEPNLSWSNKRVSASVGFKSTDDGPMDRNFSKNFSVEIPQPDLDKHQASKDKIAQLTGDLQQVLGKISDMSRKERQVKARISEMRLEEQGLQGLLADSTIKQLIHV